MTVVSNSSPAPPIAAMTQTNRPSTAQGSGMPARSTKIPIITTAATAVPSTSATAAARIPHCPTSPNTTAVLTTTDSARAAAELSGRSIPISSCA